MPHHVGRCLNGRGPHLLSRMDFRGGNAARRLSADVGPLGRGGGTRQETEGMLSRRRDKGVVVTFAGNGHNPGASHLTGRLFPPRRIYATVRSALKTEQPVPFLSGHICAGLAPVRLSLPDEQPACRQHGGPSRKAPGLGDQCSACNTLMLRTRPQMIV